MTTFNPNKITKLVTTGFIGLTTLFGAVEPAKAADFCTFAEGYHLCADYGRVDSATLTGMGEEEEFSIICRNGGAFKWESYGTLSQSEAQEFVDGFCLTRVNSY